MLDRYGREIDYLRISITDRCNLRCRYCMPKDIETVAMEEILSYEEIVSIAEAAAALNISKLRITGGEPLVRRGVSRLISMLKGIRGIETVSITTNGILLSDMLDELISAGLDGINLSLDTLDPEKYRLITGFDRLRDVLKGMDKALEKGIPLKINAVSLDIDKMCGTKEERAGGELPYDVEALTGLAVENKVDVRFIELMPIGNGKGFPGISHDRLIPLILDHYGGMERDDLNRGNGPAVYYRNDRFAGRLGFISAIHGKFCDFCNRIRLTSTGYLKSCLCYDTGVSVKEILRGETKAGDREKALIKAIEKCIQMKPGSHSFSQGEKITERHVMSAIGG